MAHSDLVKLRYYTAILHMMDLNDKGDTPEADAIRDKMDVWWYNLSLIEQSKIQTFSADLHEYIGSKSDKSK